MLEVRQEGPGRGSTKVSPPLHTIHTSRPARKAPAYFKVLLADDSSVLRNQPPRTLGGLNRLDKPLVLPWPCASLPSALKSRNTSTCSTHKVQPQPRMESITGSCSYPIKIDINLAVALIWAAAQG